MSNETEAPITVLSNVENKMNSSVNSDEKMDLDESKDLNESSSSPTRSESVECIESSTDCTTTPRRPEKTDLKTPKSSGGKSRLTQAEKQKRAEEKEARRLERERLREEKEQKREQEKAEKERKRKEKEAQRIEKEKELERQKEKKQREKEEKEEKKRLEAEEKQKDLLRKQEEKKKKEEEIRAKEEEKKKKEEEKARIKLEEEQKKAKTAERFKSFFKKVEEPKPKKPKTESIAFELKKGMSLAPVSRRMDLTDKARKESFMRNMDELLKKEYEVKSLYVLSIKVPSYTPGTCPRTRERESSEEKEISLVTPDETEKNHRAKLLQFHENYRPPYWGTWQKRSKKVSGRRPFQKDEEFLDYSVDSEEEWEEEPEGDDCNSDDEEEEEGEKAGNSDEEDGWLVEHGYLSEGEGLSDEDQQCDDPEERRKRLIAKAEAFKATVTRKVTKQPVLLIGPYRENDPSTRLDPALYKKLHLFAAFRADGKKDGEPFPTSFTQAVSA